jgi:secondary thiamine-phosphate synthase enzyme
MKVVHKLIELQTRSEIEAHDLTPQLRELLAESGVRDGYLVVSARHTTCAITVNENEPRLIEDVKNTLARLVPRDAGYLHNDIEARGLPGEPRNAHAHIAAILFGAAQVIPVMDGALALGRWQSVLFFELDGPRRRTVNVQIGGCA